uniref:Uncharacterized protein n=1 Tax=uncultured bacterium contig00001 TaxID=1181493 RepID=A0A806KF42_9BACT|nr:hypothetical protein [uncultured bacterium contig00001]
MDQSEIDALMGGPAKGAPAKQGKKTNKAQTPTLPLATLRQPLRRRRP